jgi:23S rRNA pseudouridine1911/1915/1917 synthase
MFDGYVFRRHDLSREPPVTAAARDNLIEPVPTALMSGDYSANTAAHQKIALKIAPQWAGLRLDQALQRMLPEYSRSWLQSLIKGGTVLLEDRTASAKRKVRAGEAVTLWIPPGRETLASLAQPIPLDVIFEDDVILVSNKPAGLVVHPGSGNWEGTLLNALLHHGPEFRGLPRAGIVHRLDKDTSGLMVVAKTLTAQTTLVRQLQARTVKREYVAIVHGRILRDGKVEAPIGRHPVSRTRMAIVSRGKSAVTRYRVIERLAEHTVLGCHLETGRTHQIRVHLQHIGHPLVGDRIYRGTRSPGNFTSAEAIKAFGRQALHAVHLELVHPTSLERMAWDAPLPDDMIGLLRSLRA